MQEEQRTPKTRPSGAMPPPRPPTRTAIGFSPAGDDDDSIRRQRKNETVRINLPPKPSAQPTIKLPILPVGKLTTDATPRQWKMIFGAKKNLKKTSSTIPNSYISAVLIFISQGVFVFEACTSFDRTVAILFLMIALAMTIPGYLYAFEYQLHNANVRSRCPKDIVS